MRVLVYDPSHLFVDIVSDSLAVYPVEIDHVYSLGRLEAISSDCTYDLLVSKMLDGSGGLIVDRIDTTQLAGLVILVAEGYVSEEHCSSIHGGCGAYLLAARDTRVTLPSLLTKCVSDLQHSQVPHFWIKEKGVVRSHPKADIVRVETDGNYCIVHMQNYSVSTRQRFDDLLEQIGYTHLVRIHRKYAVNLCLVEQIVVAANTVVIANCDLPIGRKYKSLLMQRVKHRRSDDTVA